MLLKLHVICIDSIGRVSESHMTADQIKLSSSLMPRNGENATLIVRTMCGTIIVNGVNNTINYTHADRLGSWEMGGVYEHFKCMLEVRERNNQRLYSY